MTHCTKDPKYVKVFDYQLIEEGEKEKTWPQPDRQADWIRCFRSGDRFAKQIAPAIGIPTS